MVFWVLKVNPTEPNGCQKRGHGLSLIIMIITITIIIVLMLMVILDPKPKSEPFRPHVFFGDALGFGGQGDGISLRWPRSLGS